MKLFERLAGTDGLLLASIALAALAFITANIEASHFVLSLRP